MTYIYDCDGWCDDRYNGRPALTAEFNEHWYNGSEYGDVLRQQDYEAGDLVTLCEDCTMKLLTEV